MGSPMQRLKPTDFSQSERQNILKRIIDSESDIYGRDLIHDDLTPCNVIVSGSAAKASTHMLYSLTLVMSNSVGSIVMSCPGTMNVSSGSENPSYSSLAQGLVVSSSEVL